MKPDGRKIVLFEQPAKVRREEIGRDNLPVRQQTDVSFPFAAPAAPRTSSIQFLLFPSLQSTCSTWGISGSTRWLDLFFSSSSPAVMVFPFSRQVTSLC